MPSREQSESQVCADLYTLNFFQKPRLTNGEDFTKKDARGSYDLHYEATIHKPKKTRFKQTIHLLCGVLERQ